MKIFKTVFVSVLTVALLASFVGVPLAKEHPPPPEKIKKLSITKWKE